MQLSCQQAKDMTYMQKRNLQLYNVKNSVVRNKTKLRIKFDDVILYNNVKINENNLMDQKSTREKCINFSYCLMSGDTSFSESKCLRKE